MKRFIVQKQRYWRSRMTINVTCKHVTFLVLIDLNVVYGSVDQNILLARLKSSIGTCCIIINATALNWFTSYLKNRSQQLPLNGCISDSLKLPNDIPHGSYPRPLVFTIYSFKLLNVFWKNPYLRLALDM